MSVLLNEVQQSPLFRGPGLTSRPVTMCFGYAVLHLVSLHLSTQLVNKLIVIAHLPHLLASAFSLVGKLHMFMANLKARKVSKTASRVTKAIP